ncbi:MAG: ABC transporter substrate-binding protein, partial [Desulfosarcinaceae bacterium]
MAVIRRAIFIFICLIFAHQPAAKAETLSPLETLKGPFDQIVTILNDPAYQSQAQKVNQRDKIWQVARPLFDFDAISRRTVGKDWDRFSEKEQVRFTNVFSEFLGHTYIDKIQGEYQNEKIVFISQLVRGPIALARTKLMRESLEIPIDYRMKQADGLWKIYDVLVENGVSLVKNYRVQFKSILQKESPAKLIERLEK